MRRFVFLGIILLGSQILNSQDSLKILKSIAFNGLDGPYIFDETQYHVNDKNKLIVDSYTKGDTLIVQVDNSYSDSFQLTLESEYKPSESSYDLPGKMIILSDIEGKFNAFSSFLMANKVIDDHHNWIFDDGHLVLLGDFVDRGKNVTQVLWLIYKLEHQAQEYGGRVHYILGNHEILNFHGDHRYNRGKYIKLAQEISGEQDPIKAIKYIYSERSELGKWLATKNVIEKIGDYIFVHAGLSPEIMAYEWSLDDINSGVRKGLNQENLKSDVGIGFLYSAKGPFWYRGLVSNRPKYSKIKAIDLDSILFYYKSKKMVVGHTVVKNISSGFDGKVIMIDVLHGLDKFSGKTKGILIENGIEYVVDDLGKKGKFIQ